jgi:hypothetical protein
MSTRFALWWSRTANLGQAPPGQCQWISAGFWVVVRRCAGTSEKRFMSKRKHGRNRKGAGFIQTAFEGDQDAGYFAGAHLAVG